MVKLVCSKIMLIFSKKTKATKKMLKYNLFYQFKFYS